LPTQVADNPVVAPTAGPYRVHAPTPGCIKLSTGVGDVIVGGLGHGRERNPMRRICLALILAGLVVAGCGSSNAASGAPAGGGGATQAPGGGGATQAPGGHGTATATVTFNGHTYNLSGGTCTDIGTVLGTEVAVGDYTNGVAGSGDYLDIFVKGNTASAVSGRAGGVPWALATGKQSGSIGSDMKGSFSGTDFVSGGPVSGTFSCSG
jgi:hypothetical protein